MNPDFLFIPNFISQHDHLFNQLINETVWDERMKARKTASYGVAYNYSQIEYEDSPFPEWLIFLNEQVAKAVGFIPNNCLLNFYPNGDSSMGFHSDTATGRTINTGVAILSLGVERKMAFKSKIEREQTSNRVLTAGSLIYLDDTTQKNWLHAIPTSAMSEPRISLSFRSIDI